MPYIVINDKDDSREMRSQLRDSMRGGASMRHYSTHFKDDKEYEDGYRKGYMDGWEDAEKELCDDKDGQMREEYRRRRDRMGRYM